MIGVIISNGSINDYSFYKKYLDQADLVICADGGAYHARRLGVSPHILLGDLDSVSDRDLEYFKEAGIAIERFPVEKDMTDTELAVTYAVEKGCTTLFLVGCTGTRLDHSLSNIFILRKLLDISVTAFLVNEQNEITLINSSIQIKREKDVKVTLLPLSEKVEGVTTKGLYYPLKSADIEMGSTWGVSNEFVDETAEISISKGLLLVIKSKD